ncbi:MAG TPA: C4-type zinc ribbon domain-containing protein [Verrucomicrobiae bacterium]
MNELLKNLVKLQELELEQPTEASKKALIEELRGNIPATILGHYDRLMARGKKGIVPVRNRVCSACHMGVPLGTIATIMHGTDIQLCDSCGRYLFLPEENGIPSPAQAAETKVAARPRRKKAAAKTP